MVICYFLALHFRFRAKLLRPTSTFYNSFHLFSGPSHVHCIALRLCNVWQQWGYAGSRIDGWHAAARSNTPECKNTKTIWGVWSKHMMLICGRLWCKFVAQTCAYFSYCIWSKRNALQLWNRKNVNYGFIGYYIMYGLIVKIMEFIKWILYY